MARPYWSGYIQISLVSFGVKLFTATETKSEIHFHQLSRKTGERIHHRNVSSEESTVEEDDIVKGYEYRKGEYVTVEPDEIANLRIASRRTLEVTQFTALEEISPIFFEKPYFVVPENDQQAQAFTVVRKAMQMTGKAALGKIAVGGREHLVAIVSPKDDSFAGMMAYLLRYNEELRDAAGYLEDIKTPAVNKDQLQLAKQLIEHTTAAFQPEEFKDEYEAALREMVEAKIENRPLPKEEPERKTAKVINLMDALKKSLQQRETPKEESRKAPASEKPQSGPQLVSSAKKAKKTARAKKSA